MDTGLSEARRCGRPCPYKGADFPDGPLGTRTQAHTASTYTCTQGVLTYAHTGSHICVHTQAHKHALGHRHPGMCRRVHTGSHAHAHISSRVHMRMFTSTQACSHLHTKLTHRCAHAQTYTDTHRHTHMHTQRFRSHFTLSHPSACPRLEKQAPRVPRGLAELQPVAVGVSWHLPGPALAPWTHGLPQLAPLPHTWPRSWPPSSRLGLGRAVAGGVAISGLARDVSALPSLLQASWRARTGLGT